MDRAKVLSRDHFDEKAYVEYYEDIQQALREGQLESGWWHYDNHGRDEGRKAFFLESYFDADFYLRAYPIVAAEIEAGRVKSAQEHYLRLGHARGFLPHYGGIRPDNAASLPTQFGGLWTDLGNARDVVDGKLEIGQITDSQASLLSSWIKNGYVVLEQAIAPDLIDAVVSDLDRACSGDMPNVQFECPDIANGLVDWQPEIVEHAAKVIDMHHFSPLARKMMFADPISEFLALIFESKSFATESVGINRGSGQEVHQDSADVPYTIPRQFAATCVTLEDVTLGAGELFCYPGSHRFADFLYGGRFKSIVEAERCGYSVEPVEVERHVAKLRERVKLLGMSKKVLEAKKGDVLVRHSDLVHGVNPVSADTTRKRFVTHYCPKRTSPLFSEHMSIDLYDHGGHAFTTQHYLKDDLVT